MGFKEDLRSGYFGEYAVWNALNHQAYIKCVVDVRDDKLFQSYDVDFLVEFSDRQFYWLEVKTDYRTHETGNIVYEVLTSGNIGCYEKMKAQIIAYYIPQNGNIYLFDVAKLRKHTKERGYQLRKISSDTDGYLIPLAELERNQVVLTMICGEKMCGFEDRGQ